MRGSHEKTSFIMLFNRNNEYTGLLFIFQRKIIFIDHPTIEINSPFYYKKYIKKVKNGSINDVTYSANDLNNQTLGHYTVTYFFKGKTYHLKIEVIDTKNQLLKNLNL